jgi:hypothetical protein
MKFIGSDFAVAVLVELFQALGEFGSVDSAIVIGIEELEQPRERTTFAAFTAITAGLRATRLGTGSRRRGRLPRALWLIRGQSPRGEDERYGARNCV